MSPEKLANDATDALTAGREMRIARRRYSPMPPKFPRGKLVSRGERNHGVYEYDPRKVLKWLSEMGLSNAASSMPASDARSENHRWPQQTGVSR